MERSARRYEASGMPGMVRSGELLLKKLHTILKTQAERDASGSVELREAVVVGITFGGITTVFLANRIGVVVDAIYPVRVSLRGELVSFAFLLGGIPGVDFGDAGVVSGALKKRVLRVLRLFHLHLGRGAGGEGTKDPDQYGYEEEFFHGKMGVENDNEERQLSAIRCGANAPGT